MGLQSFLSHAQDDPGTQEAIRRLLEKDDKPKAPQKFLADTPTVSPPTRISDPSTIPYDDPSLEIQPERPIPAPSLPPPTRLPTEQVQPVTPDLGSVPLSPPARIDPREGMSTQGMSPLDAAAAKLKVTQSASPQQRIDTADPNFVEASAPHSISRLKAAGRLFLHQLTHGGGLIGGLIGAGEGLIAPSHAQDLKHQQEIAEAQGNFNQTLKNEQGKAQVEDIQAQAEQRKNPPIKYHKPLLKTVRNPDGSEKTLQSDDYGQTWKEQPSLLSAPPVRQPHEPLIQKIRNPDGSEATFQSDDFGKTWTPSKLPASAAPPDRTSQNEEYGTAKTNAERAAKAEAAKSEAKQHSDMANALRQQEAQARKVVADLWANPVKPSMVNNKPYEDWQRRMKEGEAQAERLRTQAESSDNKRIEAETRAAEFSKPLPSPPKRTSGTPATTTHGFSISGWLTKNPGKTEADARAFHDNDPKYKAYQIIP